MTLSKRTLVALWICAYAAWYFVAQWLLFRWRGQEIAGWSQLWFIPTFIAGAVIGLITLAFPNRATITLFTLASICHILVGFGVFPR
jgi:hypothetical protein